jgi:hypothetical protein
LDELGLWGATEQGDPVTNNLDSQRLQERLARSLADSAVLASNEFSIGSSARRVEVVSGRFIYEIAAGDNYPEAICLAAIALPDFLKQHPECATSQK